MQTDLVPFSPAPPPVSALIPTRDLAVVAAQARERIADFLDASTAENTKAAYESDWRHFTEWCAALGVAALPAAPATVLAYASELPVMPHSARAGRGQRKVEKTGYSIATITRRLAVIGRRHKDEGFPNPCDSDALRRVLKGIRRTNTRPTLERDPLLVEHFHPLVKKPTTLKGLRDRALLLFGFAGGFRRSEVCALDVTDLRFDAKCVFATIRHSKTDQEGKGRDVCINRGHRLCPVTAIEEWLAAAGITEGRIFRRVLKGKGGVGESLTTEGLHRVVKGYCRKHGLDGKWGGHSLRSGFVTAAKIGGATDYAIQLSTGHKTAAMISRYTRRYDLAANNASSKLGL
jgi:integrase